MAVFIMLSTIDFDGEPDCRTIEINNIVAERMLAAKTQARQLPALQRVPKFLFRFRSVPAQAASAGGGLWLP